MRSFNVYKWKENRALKVVTKDGRPVEIISIEANDFAPVVGVIDGIPRLFNAFGEICIIEKDNKKAVYKDHICKIIALLSAIREIFSNFAPVKRLGHFIKTIYVIFISLRKKLN